MKFFKYNQNNSGGIFYVDDKVCHRLLIEAKDDAEANAKAETLGVYFDGCNKGIDCPCCGDRWTTPYDVLKFPYVYPSFDKATAERLGEKYKLKVRKIRATVKKPRWYSSWNYEIIFPSVDSYARYLADEYGGISPDVRIYYANGAITTIHSERIPK